jgi:hypothetical protein
MGDGSESKKKDGETVETAGVEALSSDDSVVSGGLVNSSEHVGTATVAAEDTTVVSSHYDDLAGVASGSMTDTGVSDDLHGGIEERDSGLVVATVTFADDSMDGNVAGEQRRGRREIFEAARLGGDFGSVTKFLLEDGDYGPDKPDNQKSFFWTRMFGETHPENSPDDSLYNAVTYFDEIVRELGLEDAPLLNDPEIREDLRGRLHEFMQYVDSKLDSVELRVKGSEGCSNFSENWRSNLKYACYCAFFIHYGEKRKGELDDEGNPRDYAYHPVRSALDNLVPRVRFFCEPTIIADVLHDVPENWEKGLLGILDVSKGGDVRLADFGKKSDRRRAIQDSLKREKGDMFDKWFQGLCQIFDTISGRQSGEFDITSYLSKIVGVGGLVDILTKTSDNRARSIIEMLSKICNYSGAAMFSAARALLIKVTDRLDNIASLKSLMKHGAKMGGPTKERVSEIGLETIHFFIALAIALKAWNIVDWLYDYMVFSDPEERERRIDLRRQSDPGEKKGVETPVLKTRFRWEFEKELKARMKDTSISDGKDYVLELRPVGVRYERSEAASVATDKGTYVRHFQHFLIFRCGKRNPEMLVAASEVFKRLFPKPLSEEVLTRGEFGSVLGERLSKNRMGVPDEDNGYSDTYGVGVWSVFNGPEDFSGKILGDVNRGYFYEDPRAEVDEFLAEVESGGTARRVDVPMVCESRLRILLSEGIDGFGRRFPAEFQTFTARFPAIISEARSKGLGAVFYADNVDTPARAARARVLALLNGIKPFVKLLVAQYSLVDCLRARMCPSVDAAREGVRREIVTIDLSGIGKASFDCPSETGSNSSGIDAEGIDKIEKVIGQLVMTMFMEKPVTAIVRVNGEYSTEVQLPAEHADLNSALAFGAPWALGREICFIEELEADGKKQFNITVDLGKPFDLARFDRQAGFVDELLAKYQSTLLLDKYQGLRGGVFAPSYEEARAGLESVTVAEIDGADEGLGQDSGDDSQV